MRWITFEMSVKYAKQMKNDLFEIWGVHQREMMYFYPSKYSSILCQSAVYYCVNSVLMGIVFMSEDGFQSNSNA